MVTSDPDHMERWRAVAAWYGEQAAHPTWAFLAPLRDLVAWAAEQPMAAKLFPGTSHHWLTVAMHPGYQPELPFFSVGGRSGGEFSFELWASVGRQAHAVLAPAGEAREVFSEFVSRLKALAERAPAPARPRETR